MIIDNAVPSVSKDDKFKPHQKRHVACLLPAYNEAGNLPQLVPMIVHALKGVVDQLTLLVVDDGSKDNTAAVALQLAKDYPLELLQLSRNFGKENAITAGLDYIDADATIIMDADCQHPTSVLREFIVQWQGGADMVVGIRRDRDDQNRWRGGASRIFYRLLSRSSDTDIHPNAGDFRLLDRRVVDALRALPESNRFMKGLYSWVGFSVREVEFSPANRATGKSHFTWAHLVALALDGLTSFSSIPLRFASIVGALVSLSSISYGLFIFLETLVTGSDLPGWATLTVSITFLGGVQLLSIGILGEYVGRIFSEVKNRPHYIVRQYYRPKKAQL